MTKYMITEQECQQGIDKRGNVCSGCGGVLTPIETVDNSDNPTFWSGCLQCGVYESGVSKLIYEIAKYLVTERHYRPYSHDQEPDKEKNPEGHKYWVSSQIRGQARETAEIIRVYEKLKSGNQ